MRKLEISPPLALSRHVCPCFSGNYCLSNFLNNVFIDESNWYFFMYWMSWCCLFFYYGKGRYCNLRSNINILIPKMSLVWDRIRSRVTSHVRVMLGQSNFSHSWCLWFFISHCLRLTGDVTETISPRSDVYKIYVILSFLHLIYSIFSRRNYKTDSIMRFSASRSTKQGRIFRCIGILYPRLSTISITI